jgi:hypothetical protein
MTIDYAIVGGLIVILTFISNLVQKRFFAAWKPSKWCKINIGWHEERIKKQEDRQDIMLDTMQEMKGDIKVLLDRTEK